MRHIIKKQKADNLSRFAYLRVDSIDQKIVSQKELLKIIRFDNIVVVTKLDRLSRSNKNLDYIINVIQRKNDILLVLNLPLTQIDGSKLNKLMNIMILKLCKYIAESER